MGGHRLEPRVAGTPLGKWLEIDVEGAEPQAGRDLGRRLPAVEVGPVPVEEPPPGLVVDLANGLVDPRHALGPVLDQVAPGLVVVLLGGLLVFRYDSSSSRRSFSYFSLRAAIRGG